MSLPAIDFSAIAATAKQAMEAYGTPVKFIEQGETTGRDVKAVIYREGNNITQLINDADNSDASAILNPDDFIAPNRLPQKFDKLRIDVAGFSRTYTMLIDPAPILASTTLPLLLVKLRAN